MIKVICFDLDGVYFLKHNSSLIKNLAQEFKLPERFIQEVLFVRAAKEGGYNDLKKGKLASQIYWSWLFKTLGVSPKTKKKDYLKVLIKTYKINPKAQDLIKKLRNQGILSAICSNNYRDNIEALNKKFNFLADFGVAVFSYEVGVLKPDKEIFQKLIEKSGVKPEEILYSDDSEDKLARAKELGIRTFIYRNFEQFCEELKRLGVEIV